MGSIILIKRANFICVARTHFVELTHHYHAPTRMHKGPHSCSNFLIPPVTLIRNQQESSRTSRNEEFYSGGNFKPSHTRGGMSRNDGGMEILYYIPRCAIRRCSELRPDSFEGQSGRSDWIRAAYSSGNRNISTTIAFQLNYFNIEIDSGSNRNAFKMHSGHSGRIWSGLPFRFSFEGDQNVSNAVGMP